MISIGFRNKLLRRAGYKCEYCLKRIKDETYQVDHVYPKSEGGQNDFNNLAVSCARCNSNKKNLLKYRDPLTGKIVEIFNPRNMRWNDHFIIKNGEIRGRTEVGRASCYLLFKITPQYLPNDLQWDQILPLQENEDLYYHLNYLRFLRLRNNFDILISEINSPLQEIEILPNQQKAYQDTLDNLLFEALFTRSNITDVYQGISVINFNLNRASSSVKQTKDFRNTLAILYQQLATIEFLAGRLSFAQSFQNRAYGLYKHNHIVSTDKISNIQNKLQRLTYQQKYNTFDLKARELYEYLNFFDDADEWNQTTGRKHILDLSLCLDSVPFNIFDNLYENCTDYLETFGYCTGIDYALGVSLRRRWWVLHFIIEERPNFELFSNDIELWKTINMFNEIREMKAHLIRCEHLIEHNKFKVLMNEF